MCVVGTCHFSLPCDTPPSPRQCKKQDSPTHADYTLSETSEQSQMFPSTAQSPTGVRRTAVWQRWLVASGDTTWRLTTTWPRASPAPFCDKTAQRRSPAVFDLSSCDMPCDAEMPARNDTGPAALEHKRNFARVMSFGSPITTTATTTDTGLDESQHRPPSLASAKSQLPFCIS